ncbi:hypothetical protein N7451_006678 [Penicillium sp. IBT 35674x]|nr:hypothetical protein N7451_006678 [Penicillium sp. IBT 35674x]
MFTEIPKHIHHIIPQIRSEYLTSLTNWEMGLYTSPKLDSYTLSGKLLAMAGHMGKNLLVSEIVDSPSIPLCYRPRVNCIISVLLDTSDMIQVDQNLVFTAPGFLANILRMLIVQIGRLTLVDVGDDKAVHMDRSADVMDASIAFRSVGVGAFQDCDAQQQNMLAGLWQKMHFVGRWCKCTQCIQRRFVCV